jgi:hypothetical protein
MCWKGWERSSGADCLPSRCKVLALFLNCQINKQMSKQIIENRLEEATCGECSTGGESYQRKPPSPSPQKTGLPFQGEASAMAASPDAMKQHTLRSTSLPGEPGGRAGDWSC